jgi:hypothetical protein
MYATGNPKTKKMLKEWIASGRAVYAFSPGPFDCPSSGWISLEGPHYPAPHRWYARARVIDSRIVEVAP